MDVIHAVLYRRSGPRSTSLDEELPLRDHHGSMPSVRSAPPPGVNTAGELRAVVSGFEAQRARLLAASARSAAASAEREASGNDATAVAHRIWGTVSPPERSTSPFARSVTPPPRGVSQMSRRALEALGQDGFGAAATRVWRTHSGSSDGSGRGASLSSRHGGVAKFLADHTPGSPQLPRLPPWDPASVAGTSMPPAAGVDRAQSAAAGWVPVSAFASSSAQSGGSREIGSIGGGGGGRLEQSTSPLSASSRSSLRSSLSYSRSLSPPPPRAASQQLPAEARQVCRRASSTWVFLAA